MLNKYYDYQIRNGRLYKYVQDVPEIILPKTVIAVEEDAFSGLKNVESITFESDSLNVDKNAFSNCEKLSFVKMPRNSKINKDAFNNSNLKYAYLDMHTGAISVVDEETAKFMDLDGEYYHKFNVSEFVQEEKSKPKSKGVDR